MPRKLLAFSIVALLLVACAAVWRVVRSRWEPGRYYDRAKGYSIRFPETWKTQEREEESLLIGYDPAENRGIEALGGSLNYTWVKVAVVELPKAMSRDQFIRWTFGLLRLLKVPDADISRVADWMTSDLKFQRTPPIASPVPMAVAGEKCQVMIDHAKARRITMSWLMATSRRTEIIYFLAKHGRGCIIYCHCAAGPDELPTYQPFFESIAQSFKLE